MSEGLSFRLAGADDADAIRALTRSAYAKWVAVIGREPLPMTADYVLALRTHRFDLLERDRALLAVLETALRPDDLWIENLAVSPAHHGQGFGRHLVSRAEDVARSLGRGKVRLLTNRAFASNLTFYGRAGFLVEREEPIQGGVVVHFHKTI